MPLWSLSWRRNHDKLVKAIHIIFRPLQYENHHSISIQLTFYSNKYWENYIRRKMSTLFGKQKKSVFSDQSGMQVYKQIKAMNVLTKQTCAYHNQGVWTWNPVTSNPSTRGLVSIFLQWKIYMITIKAVVAGQVITEGAKNKIWNAIHWSTQMEILTFITFHLQHLVGLVAMPLN